jgi:hypothetical protein
LTGFSDNLAADCSSRRFASETISFRLRKDQLDQLRKEAKGKRISLNTLASQIFDFYVSFIVGASKAGAVPVDKLTLMTLLESHSEEQLKAMAQHVMRKTGVDSTLQLQGRYDFEALIDSQESWLRATGFPYRHNIDAEKNNRHTFIIQHNMGRKYSVFAAEGFKTYFEPLVAKKVEYSITDNIIAITVEGK